MDLRVAKIIRLSGKRTTIAMDGYNLFNANTPTAYETVYDVATNGARWMSPTSVLNARAALQSDAQLFKVGVDVARSAGEARLGAPSRCFR